MNRIFKSALVVVAFTAGSAFAQQSTDTATQEITGNVGDPISISVAATGTMPLVPGAANELDAALTVSSTKAFTITAVSDQDNMTEANGTNYEAVSPEVLASTPSIDATVDGAESFEGTTIGTLTLGTTPVVIFNGDEAIQDKTVTSTVTQPVNYTDVVLTAPNKYRMVVTYTAALAL